MDTPQTNPLRTEADERYAKGRFDEAMDLYTQIASDDENTDAAWAQSRIGAILAQKGELDAAEDALNRAIELDPKLPQARSNLGNVFYARGDYTGAEAAYKQASELDPSNPIFLENLHAAYKKQKKYAEAVSALKRANTLSRNATVADAKERLNTVSAKTKSRFGCGSTALLLLVITTVGLIALLQA